MKHFKHILTYIFVLALSISFGQSLEDKHTEIFSIVGKIDSDSTYRTVVLSNEEFLDHIGHGGQITAYIQDTLLMKITVVLYYSHGKEVCKYFVFEGELIYMEETFDSYEYNEELSEMNYEKIERNFQGKYVFETKKMIDLISLGHNRFEDDEIDCETTILNDFNRYIKLIRKKEAG